MRNGEEETQLWSACVQQANFYWLPGQRAQRRRVTKTQRGGGGVRTDKRLSFPPQSVKSSSPYVFELFYLKSDVRTHLYTTLLFPTQPDEERDRHLTEIVPVFNEYTSQFFKTKCQG